MVARVRVRVRSSIYLIVADVEKDGSTLLDQVCFERVIHLASNGVCVASDRTDPFQERAYGSGAWPPRSDTHRTLPFSAGPTGYRSLFSLLENGPNLFVSCFATVRLMLDSGAP